VVEFAQNIGSEAGALPEKSPTGKGEFTKKKEVAVELSKSPGLCKGRKGNRGHLDNAAGARGITLKGKARRKKVERSERKTPRKTHKEQTGEEQKTSESCPNAKANQDCVGERCG